MARTLSVGAPLAGKLGVSEMTWPVIIGRGSPLP